MTADDLNRAIPMPPDTWALDYRPHHAIASGIGDVERQVWQAALGPAFTLVHRGRVVAMWGLVIPWPGLAEGWLVVDRVALRPIGLPFTRGARRFCDLANDILGVRRLQVHVQIANASFMMWARAAGFEVDARLDCYLPGGESVLLMSRTWR